MLITLFSGVVPFALFHYPIEAVGHERVVRREDLHPARRLLVAPAVLETEAHRLLVALPPRDGVPLQVDGLLLRCAVLAARVQPKARDAHRGDHVPVLATITCTVREHDITVTWDGARQLQILRRLALLQRFQLVQPSFGPHVASVHLVDCLVEDELRRLLTARQRQLPVDGEQPAAHAQTRRAAGAVVVDVELMGRLRRLQLALEVILDDLEEIKILLRVGREVGLLHQLLPHLLRVRRLPHRHRHHVAVRQHDFDVDAGRQVVLGVGEELLHRFALGDHAHRANLLQVLLEAAAARIKLLLAQLERPLAGQLGKVEADEFLLQRRVQVGELAIATRAQLPARHVDREHDVLLAVACDDVVLGNADGQRTLLAVVDVRVTAGIFRWF